MLNAIATFKTFPEKLFNEIIVKNGRGEIFNLNPYFSNSRIMGIDVFGRILTIGYYKDKVETLFILPRSPSYFYEEVWQAGNDERTLFVIRKMISSGLNVIGEYQYNRYLSDTMYNELRKSVVIYCQKKVMALNDKARQNIISRAA